MRSRMVRWSAGDLRCSPRAHRHRHHPFWGVGDINAWVEAADLKRGMWLCTSAGTYTQITATEHKTAHHQRFHNLTTANHHTYYVLAGETPVLVHNFGGCPKVGLLDPSHQAIGDPDAKGGIYALVAESGAVMRTGKAKT